MYTAHIAPDSDTAAPRVQTCAEHSRAVAALASAALEPCGLSHFGYLAGLLHDCGKFTDEFQDYLCRASRGEPVRKGSVIHTFAGVGALLNHFHAANPSFSWEDITSEILAVSVGSHHGLFDLWDERHESGFAHRLTRQPEYDARALAAFYRECADEQEVQALFQQCCRELTDFFNSKLSSCAKGDAEGRFAFGLLVRLITSAVVDGDREDTRRFMSHLPPEKHALSEADWASCSAHLHAFLAAFPQQTPIQLARSDFSTHCALAAEAKPGLYRLDLPTGGGKTLSALRFAVLHAQKHHLRRIFYVAPLLSVIEQNADVVHAALGDSVTILEHHSNVLLDAQSPEKAADTELLQENWDAPVIITTLVQLLNTLFSGQMASVRRFHQLVGSMLILDEVQSLPPRMLSMFNCAVNFLVRCCGATVVLCSATQPTFDASVHAMLPPQRLVSVDLFNRHAPLFRRTNIVDGGSCTLEALVQNARALLQTRQSLLIICNTRREAAGVYQLLSDWPDGACYHLSASMCMAHRRTVLADLLEALRLRKKLICVSTSLIEAGIDVSFDAVIRLSAGLDSIVQAAGRCNRHGEHPEPQPVHICALKGEKLGMLREIGDAQHALNALLAEYRQHPERYDHNLASDAAVRDYYTFLYRAMPCHAQDHPVDGQTLFDLLSLNSQFAREAKGYYLRQAFDTAGKWFNVFDDASQSLLVPFGEGRALIAQLADCTLPRDLAATRTLLSQSSPYTVSLSRNRMNRLLESGMAYTLLGGSLCVLNEGFYDEILGISTDGGGSEPLIL